MSDDTLVLARRAVALGLTVGDREMQAWGRLWSMDTNAWLLTRGNDIAPIPGTRRVARVEENTAAESVDLTVDQLDRLNKLTPAACERHDEANMAKIDQWHRNL